MSVGGSADIEAALEQEVRSVLAEHVARGTAVVSAEDASARRGPSRVLTIEPTHSKGCPITVCAQSDDEVSFFIGPPGRPDVLTVDLWDRDQPALLAQVRRYIEAVVAGRVEIEAPDETEAPNAMRGRVTFRLGDGSRPRHDDNVWPWTRRREWRRYTFEPY